ncbi:MAG: hypothetical protein ABSF50_05040 [Burkholderiaceae bacterium]|jgi:hypothetical protein
MILKTYARILTTDADRSVEVFQRLHGGNPHLRIKFREWEIVAIGDVYLVAGTEEALRPIRNVLGPLVVDNLEQTQAALVQSGARIVLPIDEGPTGPFLHARHPDGSIVEYTQWRPYLVEKWITMPHGRGVLSSQV